LYQHDLEISVAIEYPEDGDVFAT